MYTKMSVDTLVTPLSEKAPIWSNLNVNSINVASGGSSLQGPLTITENSASGSPIVSILETNATTSNSNVGLLLSNQSGSETLSILTRNDPSPITGITTSGPGGLFINTLSSTSNINLLVNTSQALVCNYISPGVTQTAIQNLQLPSTGGTASNLNYYEEYSAAFVFSGPWGATTYTRNVTITRIGRMCTLKIDAINQTASVGTGITMTGSIPARFVPAVTADYTSEVFPIMVFNNAAIANGILNLSNTGAILVQCINNAGGFPLLYGNFVGTSATGFGNIFVSYSV